MICDLCGCELARPESKRLWACAECRLVARNDSESLSDRRRRVIAARLAELESGDEVS